MTDTQMQINIIVILSIFKTSAIVRLFPVSQQIHLYLLSCRKHTWTQTGSCVSGKQDVKHIENSVLMQ